MRHVITRHALWHFCPLLQQMQLAIVPAIRLRPALSPHCFCTLDSARRLSAQAAYALGRYFDKRRHWAMRERSARHIRAQTRARHGIDGKRYFVTPSYGILGHFRSYSLSRRLRRSDDFDRKSFSPRPGRRAIEHATKRHTPAAQRSPAAGVWLRNTMARGFLMPQGDAAFGFRWAGDGRA